jgi:hypothetical protein
MAWVALGWNAEIMIALGAAHPPEAPSRLMVQPSSTLRGEASIWPPR